VSILQSVQRGRVATRPIRALVYGVEGVGKSTFAAAAPDPLFLDAEQGTLGLDVARLSVVTWADFLRVLKELKSAQHNYRTIVLDTLDSLDRLLVAHVCRAANASTIEDVGGGYGKGWQAVAEAWDRVLEDLAALQAGRALNVIGLAHANVETFRDPAGGDWSRWSLRLPKKSAATWKGWVEELLFATRDVQSNKRDKKGRGGERVLYTRWAPGRDCKNRRDLPERLPLDWSAFSSALRAGASRGRLADADDHSMEDDAPPVEITPEPEPEPIGPPVAEPAMTIVDSLKEQIRQLIPGLSGTEQLLARRALDLQDEQRLRSAVTRFRAVLEPQAAGQ